MNLKTKLCATGATLATTAALGLVPVAAASAAPSAAPVAAPAAPAPSPTAIASSTINQATPLGQFTGTFTPTRFVSQRGQLGVTGVVAGTITNAAGVVTPVSQVVTTTVQSAATAGSCDILNLVLGPLHLNVLGL